MRTNTLLALAFALASLTLPQSLLLAQGPLTPPGAPAPVMKTLDQIEPRTPIAALPFTISQPGSYYLTGNLTGAAGVAGITIAAANVTIDLDGFDLVGGGGAAASGIIVNFGISNVTIRNGTVRGWSQDGVMCVSALSTNVNVVQVRATNNAVRGIVLGNDGTASECVSRANNSHGFVGGTGSRFTACTAVQNLSGGHGFDVGSRSVLTDCVATGNAGDGIHAASGTVVARCSAGGNVGDGIDAGTGSIVQACTTLGNTGAGVLTATGLTLDQGEGRIPITSAPFTITAPGSYYLTSNLSVTTGSAITISTDDVTLDLNGWTISSTANPASGSGVSVDNNSRRNIAIRNGHIKGTTTYASGVFTKGGFSNGIYSLGVNLLVTGVTVSAVGDHGIYLGSDDSSISTAQSCHARVCGASGITASTVSQCQAETAGWIGIDCAIARDSRGRSVGPTVDPSGSPSGMGIRATIAENSYGHGAIGMGLYAVFTASNCFGGSNSNGPGLSTSNATNCRGGAVSGTGLYASNATNCYGRSDAGTGLEALSATNCYGQSNNGLIGLDANPGTASFCRGERTGGTAITATNAIGCTAAAGTITATTKSLGTP